MTKQRERSLQRVGGGSVMPSASVKVGLDTRRSNAAAKEHP
jgi:hypothetical protein